MTAECFCYWFNFLFDSCIFCLLAESKQYLWPGGASWLKTSKEWGRCTSPDCTCCSQTKPASFIRTSWSQQVGQPGLVLKPAFSGNTALKKHFHSFAVNIFSRAEWGAVPPKSREELKGPAQKAVIHHTAVQKCSSMSGCRDLLLSIQRFHMETRKFDDIGYKWVAPRLKFPVVEAFLLYVPETMD